MLAAKNSPKAQTVLGPIDAHSLGITLPHEHIFADGRNFFFSEPADPAEKALAYAPVTLENLAWVRAHALSNADCLQMPGETVLAKELLAYKQAEGNTIVDVSTKPFGGVNPAGLKRLAQATSLNIIMGTGYYQGLLYAPEVTAMTEEQLQHEIVRDLTVGIGDTGVRAGIIGDVRGRGLFIGVELVKNKETKEPLPGEAMGKILSELLSKGIIAVPCGRYHNVVRFMPSLIITKEYLEKATDILLNICRKY